MATPDELLTKLDDITNGIDDHGGLAVRDVMHDIIADIAGSYQLAMQGAGIDNKTVAKVAIEVNDYIVNNYSD